MGRWRGCPRTPTSEDGGPVGCWEVGLRRFTAPRLMVVQFAVGVGANPTSQGSCGLLGYICFGLGRSLSFVRGPDRHPAQGATARASPSFMKVEAPMLRAHNPPEADHLPEPFDAEDGAATWTEALFGLVCPLCAAPGARDGLGCESHRLRLPAISRCRTCAAPLPPALAGGFRCGACSRFLLRSPPAGSMSGASGIERAICVGDYEEPLLRELVLAFKHGGRPGLAPYLGALLLASAMSRTTTGPHEDAPIDAEEDPRPGDLLVPVPLHSARWLERGYDQARLLADAVAAAAPTGSLASRSLLRRSRATAPQGAIGLISRADNVHGAFVPAWPRCLSSWLVRGRRVWLVDDVWTSGATLRECATTLRRMGAAWCGAMVVARASGAAWNVQAADPTD